MAIGSCYRGKDEIVRVVHVKTKNGIFKRPTYRGLTMILMASTNVTRILTVPVY